MIPAFRNERDQQFQQIQFIHGTNSSVLASLSQTDYRLLATGDLLNRGIAPMGGELNMGGMAELGVNQHSISGGTMADVELCWNRYALDRANSFKPDQLTPAKFEETLSELEKTPQSSEHWDPLVINLMRYKQWNPEEFAKLCGQNQARIDALIKQTQPRLSYPDYLLKALEYDPEEMKKGISDLSAREKILEELGYAWKKDDFFMNQIWTDKWHWQTGLDTHPASENYQYDKFDKAQYSRMLFDIINIKLTGNLHNEVRYLRGDPWIPYDTIQPQLLKRKTPEDQKYKRLHLLFDLSHRPVTFQTREQRESLVKPFPILLGSTRMYGEQIRNERVIPSGAALGTDIDVMIVRPQDSAAAANWLKANSLAHKIALYSSEVLNARPAREISFFSRMKHSLQGMTNGCWPSRITPTAPTNSFISDEALAKAVSLVNAQVLPVYRTDYPNGGARHWHGVIHASRAFLFGHAIGALFAKKGKAQPENLLIAAAAHDIERKSDFGEDLWDKESGARCKKILLNNGVIEEEVALLEKAVAEKEEAVTLEQKIVHDADCIEINRFLKDTDDFEPSRLWMKQELDVDRFIAESKKFIKLTEDPKIKAYVEGSSDPIACLYQILFYCHDRHGELGLLARTVNNRVTDHFSLEQQIKELITQKL